jgi:hypothetical protein
VVDKYVVSIKSVRNKIMNHQTQLYLTLANYGKVIPLSIYMQNCSDFVNWTEENFQYVKYNPRKEINRYGLSVTSLDGGLSGRPDLDSLTEYNYEMGNFDRGNFIREEDLKVPTPVYNHPDMKELCDLWQPDLFRTHILRIDPGGYFPPHRDHTNINLESFRLLMPLQHCTPPHLTFIIDGDIINWNTGQLYFVDTAKMHYLFNPTFEPSYMLVMNIGVNEDTVQRVIDNFQSR